VQLVIPGESPLIGRIDRVPIAERPRSDLNATNLLPTM
jgi:hypothetical protein